MERMLEKLAHQLNSLDEASLVSLWGRYATQVERFEPTKRWEEAALCLCLCQAVRWKNQLFNHYFAASVRPGNPFEMKTPKEDGLGGLQEATRMDSTENAPVFTAPQAQKNGRKKPKSGKVLDFPPTA